MKPLTVKFLFIFLLSMEFMIPKNLIGQTPFWGKAESELKFKHLTTEQGLSSNVTSVILEDKQGFMWFGTDAGLNRYDGFQFKTYNFNPQQNNSLSNDVIKALHQNKQGKIWIGTEKGINLFNPEDESLDYFLSEADNAGSLSNNTISAIAEDKKETLWVGTFYGLNKLIKWENNQPFFQRFYNVPDKTNSISNNRIYCIFSDSKDNLWIGTEGGGLNLLTAVNKNANNYNFRQIRSVRSDNSKLEESIIYSISEDMDGNILVGSNNGLSLLKPNGDSFFIKHYLDNENGLKAKNVYSVIPDKKGQIWLATFGGGLFLFNPEDETFKQYQYDIYNSQSISRNHLYSAYLANDGILWVAARETGIDRVNPGSKIFTHLRHIPTNPNSLSNNVVKSISESPVGNYWIGTFGGGLNKYNPKTGLFTTFKYQPNNKSSLCSDIVESTCFDHLGRLWIGTAEGLNIFNIKTGKFKQFVHDPANPNSITGANIWFVHPAKDKSGIWVATYDGLDKYDWNKNKFYHFKNDPHNETTLRFNFIRSIYEDDENNLWICTWGGGLDQLKLNENNDLDEVEFIHHQNKPDDKSSLSNDLVNTFFEDSKNNLWVGTQGGLNKFDKKTGKFTTFYKSDGLADNVVKGILEDDSGNIWISTQNGLSRFNPDTEKFKNYYKKDGLQGNIFNLSACLRNSRNEFMFGGNNGISVFSPHEISETNEFPKVYFSGLKINNQSVLPKQVIDGRILFEKSLNQTMEIKLKHNENVVTFDFTAVEYLYPEKIEFAYKLEGADKEWNHNTSNNRSVTYSGLKKGKYKFRVKASNVEGEWGDNEISLELKVTPALGKSNLAYFMYFIVLFVLAYFIRGQIKERTKIKRELAKEKEEHKRQAEIDQFKLQFFTNISHELRTPLTLISGPLQKIMGRKGKLSEKQAENYLSVMNRSVSVLSKLVDQLLDFRKAEQNKMELNVTYADIGEQLRSIHANFQDFADQKNLQFELELDQPSLHFWYDTDKVEKILYNLLSNAFKFTSVGGKILVKLKNKGEVHLPEKFGSHSNEDYFCLVVEDTGIGISDENKEYIFNRFAQIGSGEIKVAGTGIGLSFTKIMVELHHGFIDLKSEVNKGSKFLVWLPATEQLFHEDDVLRESGKIKSLAETGGFTPPLLPDMGDAGDDEQISSKEFTILIVEDYGDLRTFLSNLFSKSYNILQASNGREGLEKVHKHGPDLIITDVMMPEMDGLEFTKSVKKNLSSSHIPIIMLTARNTIDNEIEGLETGADYYISKPFNVEQLQLIVRNIIENRKKTHQKFKGVKIPEPKEITIVSVDEKFMLKVGEVIETNISEPEFSVEFLASETGLSTVHLYRKLKALTGLTPNEFIRSFRMKRATQLLEQKKLMISEVAYAVGFNDPKYFRKCFKKAFGVSPSEYAKSEN